MSDAVEAVTEKNYDESYKIIIVLMNNTTKIHR